MLLIGIIVFVEIVWHLTIRKISQTMLKKLFTIAILNFMLAHHIHAAQIEVCQTCPISSLRQAIHIANNGDIILIQPGVYKEGNIEVNKSLTLKGIDYPILDGNDSDEILTITADSVIVEGIEFHNAGKSHLKDLAAIRIRKGKYFVILNNYIIDAYFGIYIEHGSYGLIEGNTVIGLAKNEASSGNAIHAWYAQHLEISSNYLKGHRDGIYLEFVNNSMIVNNLSKNNLRYGLHFMFSNDDEYQCNKFQDNGAGVAVMFSKRIEMLNNLFEQNWGTAAYGLLLKEIYDANIAGNQFIQNTVGIFLEGATRIEYRYNQFYNNGWAIQMTGGCLDNNFIYNNFESNTLDMVVNSRVNNNTLNNNYWSEYTGYDLDRDGFGDIPFRPVKLYSYVLTQSPESIILLRSFFIDLLNFSEKVSPALTPQDVADYSPLINRIS